jgi:predicted O-methyltransferase YrrM
LVDPSTSVNTRVTVPDGCASLIERDCPPADVTTATLKLDPTPRLDTVGSAAEVIISPVHRVRSLATYVVKGSPLRRSRLHNHKGERVDVKGLAYLPHSVATTIRLKLTGRRPESPWLGYRAVKCLEALIEPDWRILEFGAGMSTIWLARRCAFVLSLETHDRWFADVRAHLELAGLENVDCRLCSTTDNGTPDYGRAVSDQRGSEFDLALVDGARRDLAIEIALGLVKAGGYVFLDNTDLPNDDCRIAAARLGAAAARVWVFNDLSPSIVMVNEGTLGQLPEPPTSRP